MRITCITEESNGLIILVGEEYEYFIPKREYDCDIDGMSDWINQLLEKKWSDKDSLYQVGAILSKYTKNSKIDWKSTFFVVERTFFIREIQEQEQVQPVKTKRAGDIEIHQSQDFFSNLMRAMEIGRETHTKENTKLIKKRVEQNLTKFGIVG
jgi:hypothetical protein